MCAAAAAAAYAGCDVDARVPDRKKYNNKMKRNMKKKKQQQKHLPPQITGKHQQ